MADSTAAGSSASRTRTNAETALSKTFPVSPATLSSGRNAECTKGTPAIRLAASRTLKSGQPARPSARQKRMTVGSLTSAAWAISPMVMRATSPGWAMARRATRAAARLRPGRRARSSGRMDVFMRASV